MQYSMPKSKERLQKHITALVDDAALDLAQEKDHIMMLQGFEDPDILVHQVRIALCSKYGISANNANKLIEKYLSVSVPQKCTCSLHATLL